MSHLGNRLTAMIDGELGHEARDRVLSHLTVCAECRAEAEVHRSLKSQLGHLGGPHPSSDLIQRLLGLAAPGGPMPRPLPPGPGRGMVGAPRSRPGSDPSGGAFSSGVASEPFGSTPLARPHVGAVPAGNRPRPASGKAARGLSGRLRYALVGAASLVALALSAGFVAGGQSTRDDQTRSVAPPVEVYAVEHAATVGEVPVTHHRSGDPGNTVTLIDSGP